MTKFVWTEQLNIGIEVIDQQHRRIGEYINQMDDALSFGHSREEIGWLINEVTDYTISHFGFEESLQNEANYPFAKPHKKVHDLFAERVAEYREKFEKGEDVAAGLNSLLVTWLLNHIKRDDADYVQCVKVYLQQQKNTVEKKKGFFSSLFG